MDLRKFVLIICLTHTFLSFSMDYGSVVFSELMVDPAPAVGLPEVEYVEIYNRSTETLSLKGWMLCYGEKAYPFPDCSLDAAGYGVLCSKDVAALLPSVVVFATFPVLGNTGKQIYLLNEKKELVTCLTYSAEWHENAFKAKGGWSLECIDVNNLSGQASNWTSSKDRRGGTPGLVNAVVAENPDEVQPVCTDIYVLSSRQVELIFSKSLQPTELGAATNYRISSPSTMVSSVLTAFPANRSVLLNLSDSLVGGEVYELILSNLTDVSGFSLKETSLTFGLPETPDYFDLSLNEVLFNPLADGCDYVEFVNISTKCLDLSQLWLTSRSEAGVLKEGVRVSEKPIPCMPGSYWLLSVCADSVLSTHVGRECPNKTNLPSFPSLPDASGNVVLVTSSAQLVDEMSYKESMHFPLISLCEGISLEKLNPQLVSGDPESWRSASSSSGFGTPGFLNSQYRDLSDAEAEGFSVLQKWITPDNDGQDDFFTINYRVKESSLASLTVYDLHGRVVKELASNELLAATGSVFWDGTGSDGDLVPFGRYILQTEYFTLSGQRNKKRFVLTVLF